MNRRAHISFKTLYASALRIVGEIPYDHAKLMHEDQIISLFSPDHGILHAIEPIDEHWNLTPTFRGPHKEKSRKDTRIVAKVKRTEEKHQAFLSMRSPAEQHAENDHFRAVLDAVTRRPRAKIQSRGFQKDTRPKGQRFGRRT